MIHYHGLPISPGTAAAVAIHAGHAFVSFAHQQQLSIAIEVSQSFAIDNGAFSAWKSGNPVKDWSGYYDFVAQMIGIPNFDWAVIPDIIDGTESQNDDMIAQWPHGKFYGVPVWHMHESLLRLNDLATAFPRICIGSSRQFATIGTKSWIDRMDDAMMTICDGDGKPKVKIHGLRMLDPTVFTKYPFASADSTNIGRNVGIDQKWKGTYLPHAKESRALVMRGRIESSNAPSRYVPSVRQGEMW